MASSFVRNCLSPLRPVADIAPDVLQISSLNPWWILQSLGSKQGDVQIHEEIAADGELMEWLVQISEGVLLPHLGDFAESMVRNRVWRQLMERGYEWACPEHPRSVQLLQKIDLRDSSHSMARLILVDELLFRGKVSV
ncbi:hypothetical protein BFJ63_vAg18059 [Fusarium oxysporum f. sp. narcissi]|uniref:Uncharacterized protein n=1 Tax=Fusarium oxysporum f. sp. narcissi TaxID=451672 RepID=A0A4Q2UYB0_FUSOX|nr:hypothetical protein BFJ63_vAg18059 [Fusarium oxysporum f. sp. narcissi]